MVNGNVERKVKNQFTGSIALSLALAMSVFLLHTLSLHFRGIFQRCQGSFYYLLLKIHMAEFISTEETREEKS